MSAKQNIGGIDIFVNNTAPMLWDGQTTSRHIIVACIDVYTRRVKFLVSRSSSSAAVAALARLCLLDWGQAEEWGTDNGADYVAAHMSHASRCLHSNCISTRLTSGGSKDSNLC